MSDVVIKVENVSKQYRLGQVGVGTLSHDLNRFWARIRGKEDPYLKVGETNDRTMRGESEYVWALKDIHFEVRRGEVLGIVGRNGAGKSTLLKLLSQITRPTTGIIKLNGRVGSLLEVGTGFHPDLTGRENIYINGAILGMRKWEIDKKLDEIIDFAGVERYIDTPVKRYSSGMMVRLGFSVAAHLEPEILIVDEVLAVGDAEFQKRCLGKMGEVSKNDGRTILFVSHNLAAMKSLCQTGLFLNQGESSLKSDIDSVIDDYNLSESRRVLNHYTFSQDSKSKAGIESLAVLNANKQSQKLYKTGESFIIQLKILVNEPLVNPIVSVRLSNSMKQNIMVWRSNDYKKTPVSALKEPGVYELNIKVDDLFLLDDSYFLSCAFADSKEVFTLQENIVSLNVVPSSPQEDVFPVTKKASSGAILYHPGAWSLECY